MTTDRAEAHESEREALLEFFGSDSDTFAGHSPRTVMQWRSRLTDFLQAARATPPTEPVEAAAVPVEVATWVSVEDRMPEPSDDGSEVSVWVWNGETVDQDDYAEQFEQPAGPAVGGWISTGWDFGQNGRIGRPSVTHWMPRETPAPPYTLKAAEPAAKKD